MSEPDFRVYIDDLIAKYGTAQKLADAIGISLSAFSRGVRNAHTLGVDKLLRLAIETGDKPERVLRIAGKGDVADLLERLYGLGASQPTLSGPHREVLALWDALSDEARLSVLTILKGLAATNKRRRIVA